MMKPESRARVPALGCDRHRQGPPTQRESRHDGEDGDGLSPQEAKFTRLPVLRASRRLGWAAVMKVEASVTFSSWVNKHTSSRRFWGGSAARRIRLMLERLGVANWSPSELRLRRRYSICRRMARISYNRSPRLGDAGTIGAGKGLGVGWLPVVGAPCQAARQAAREPGASDNRRALGLGWRVARRCGRAAGTSPRWLRGQGRRSAGWGGGQGKSFRAGARSPTPVIHCRGLQLPDCLEEGDPPEISGPTKADLPAEGGQVGRHDELPHPEAVRIGKGPHAPPGCTRPRLQHLGLGVLQGSMNAPLDGMRRLC